MYKKSIIIYYGQPLVLKFLWDFLELFEHNLAIFFFLQYCAIEFLFLLYSSFRLFLLISAHLFPELCTKSNIYLNTGYSIKKSLSNARRKDVTILLDLVNGLATYVTYWPTTEPSIKRCTCVNKRRGHESRWMSDKNITRTQTAGVSCSWSQLGTRCQIESQRQTEGFGPSVTHGWATPAKMNAGSICSSLSPSPTHLSHTININPFENKVWEIYFYKEVCSFVHWSRHYCWLCFRIYLYMYVPIQHIYHIMQNFSLVADLYSFGIMVWFLCLMAYQHLWVN